MNHIDRFGNALTLMLYELIHNQSVNIHIESHTNANVYIDHGPVITGDHTITFMYLLSIENLSSCLSLQL